MCGVCPEAEVFVVLHGRGAKLMLGQNWLSKVQLDILLQIDWFKE